MDQLQTRCNASGPQIRTPDTASGPDFKHAGTRQFNRSLAAHRLNRSKIPTPLRMDSPALDVLAPFFQQVNLTVNRSVPIDRAAKIIMDLEIALLTVVDNDGRALGTIESSDVLGEKPIKLAHDRNLHHDQIIVEDIMVPFSDMHVMSLERVSKMSVAAILSELNTQGNDFALVVDNLDKVDRQVEGVLSARSLIRHLDPTATWMPAPRSFADIEAAIGP